MDHLQRVQREFTRQARTFASAPEVTDAALTRRFVDALGDAAAGLILDVASGPGIISAAVAATARAVFALDLTPDMLRQARLRCAAASRRNVAFIEGDATRLPFSPAAFDAVVTRLSVHHFSQPARAIAEMARVLRPGGVFVLADVISSEDRHESDLHNAIEVLRDPSHVRMLPLSALSSLLTEAGFRIEEQAVWERPREFAEWLAIANDPARTAPLRTVLATLARHDETAGIGLRLGPDTLFFFHRWALFRALKPLRSAPEGGG
ncbi:MAG: class I SAM-dependent methyltransferase [Acetobacteraceae bacterium]